MLPRKKPAVLVLFLAFLGLGAANSVGAQVFDLDKGRVALTRLDGLWRFHPGDDAHWAYPSFDDSSWPLLRSDRGWNSQGYPGMSGFGWYRFSIRIPEGTQPLALYFPRLMTSYEVYADGHQLGAFGGMPPYASCSPVVLLFMFFLGSAPPQRRQWSSPFVWNTDLSFSLIYATLKDSPYRCVQPNAQIFHLSESCSASQGLDNRR
jgi:hypothetical protein